MLWVSGHLSNTETWEDAAQYCQLRQAVAALQGSRQDFPPGSMWGCWDLNLQPFAHKACSLPLRYSPFAELITELDLEESLSTASAMLSYAMPTPPAAAAFSLTVMGGQERCLRHRLQAGTRDSIEVLHLASPQPAPKWLTA